MSNQLTNVEFVTRMMEFSPAGPMAQLVVIHALEGYVRQVANIPIKEWLTQCQRPIPENRVWLTISAGAWHAACVSMARDFDTRDQLADSLSAEEAMAPAPGAGLKSQLEAKGVDSSDLDSLVHDAASRMASFTNNEGMSSQLEFLRVAGVTDQEILEGTS